MNGLSREGQPYHLHCLKAQSGTISGLTNFFSSKVKKKDEDHIVGYYFQVQSSEHL